MTVPAFVLIHGLQHNGACWTPLVEALARRGAPAVAIDLPCDDPYAGLRAYADTVISRTALLDDIVVVGHSLGGLTAPIVASERPVRGLIFLCAAIPSLGLSLSDQMNAEPEMVADWVRDHPYELVLDEDVTYRPFPPDYAKEFLYHDCSPRYQDWAVTQLRRQAQLPIVEISPLTEWPAVPMRAIISQEDRAASPDWFRRVLRDRFNIIAEEIRGGHSPFLSRPEELAALLLQPYSSGAEVDIEDEDFLAI